MMNMTHVTPFLEGMDGLDSTTLGNHLSDDVSLYSPFVTEPFLGKDNVLNVLRVLLTSVDEFQTTAIIAGEDRAAIVLRIRVGDAEVTGVDDMCVGPDGLITRMSIQWRPLEQMVAIQQILAPLVGAPALKLVEIGSV